MDSFELVCIYEGALSSENGISQKSSQISQDRLKRQTLQVIISFLHISVSQARCPPKKGIFSQVIKDLVNRGKNVTVKYATKIETWDRAYLAGSVQEDFSKAIEKADIPAGATTAIPACVAFSAILSFAIEC
ncbi:predicted protein [Sclerotinia sclerotiorum 1980 UF-70]|uniref:Uncharacterized protein n=1 Tax=Sclerotinia sclerotiorum (strain ATCC 18683 / 1980 / Ss-1) TaxID=665079 RepID=A7EBZ9_SCLS1|nr:predicted protein [Sclerotinia sclerotiorum 1980 UF-70]EDN99977.1 predicted protein [Sclerotinia sclerotiorum 1980 UF-70]